MNGISGRVQGRQRLREYEVPMRPVGAALRVHDEWFTERPISGELERGALDEGAVGKDDLVPIARRDARHGAHMSADGAHSLHSLGITHVTRVITRASVIQLRTHLTEAHEPIAIAELDGLDDIGAVRAWRRVACKPALHAEHLGDELGALERLGTEDEQRRPGTVRDDAD